LQEGPIHGQVPDGAVDAVYGGEEDEEAHEAAVVASLDAVEGEGDVVEDGSGVLAKVGEVREPGAGVVVASKTLKGAPDAGEGGEETEEPRVRAIALRWVVPVVGVEAEEEFDVLSFRQ
jgi:hypothetical protein